MSSCHWQDSANLAIYAASFFLTTLGIVYVQEAERQIPMNYASRYQAGALSRQSYLPFKVRGNPYESDPKGMMTPCKHSQTSQAPSCWTYR